MNPAIRVQRTAAQALLFCLAFVLPVRASDTLRGQVTRVFDGDSFLIELADRRIVEVRLAEIDAPEKDQPHADAARAALRELILDREVELRVLDQDRYGRSVARAWLQPRHLDINAELVSQGHAWVYRRHLRDRSLLELENAARESRRGLWALPEAQRAAPWTWRRTHPPAEPQNVDKPLASMSR